MARTLTVIILAALLVEGTAAARPGRMTLLGNLKWMVARKHESAGLPRTGERYQAELTAARALLRQPIAASAWGQVRWAEIQRLALERLVRPERIAQGKRTLLCGPATALNTTATFNPLRYARLVREVYSQGTFNGLRVDAGLRALTVPVDPPGKAGVDNANPLDWMMLTALRTAYGRGAFRGGKGFDLLSSNLPREVRWWLQEVAGFRSTRVLTSVGGVLSSPRRRIAKINGAFDESRAVVLLMDMKDLRADHHTMHWMRLVAPIERTPDGVKLVVFDHGTNRTYHLSEKLFSRRLPHVITGSGT